MKYDIGYEGTFLKNQSLSISAGVFSKIQPLSFDDLSGMFRFFNTATSLLDKRHYYDYYYAAGWNLSVGKMLVPQIGVTLKYAQEKQTPAFKNTDYSFRKHDQPFRENLHINDVFLRTIGFSLFLDPNKYKFIDYGDGEEESFTETAFPAHGSPGTVGRYDEVGQWAGLFHKQTSLKRQYRTHQNDQGAERC